MALAGNVTATFPVFVSVTVCGRLVMFAGWSTKFRNDGETSRSAPVSPVPVRPTVCFPPNEALLESVNAPLKEPAAGGVNEAVIVQLAPTASDWLQLLATTAKFALAVTVVAPSAAFPAFVSVTVCAGLASPICEFPKFSVLGASTAIGRASPVPSKGNDSVPRGSLLTILSVELRLPAALGVKNSWKVHWLAPLGIVNGGAVQYMGPASELTVYSEETAAMEEMVNGPPQLGAPPGHGIGVVLEILSRCVLGPVV